MSSKLLATSPSRPKTKRATTKTVTINSPAAESVPAEQSRLYASAAKRILKSLADHYAVWDQRDEAILLHGTGHYPAGKNIDVGLIYGDYYFVEALAKLRGQRDMFW